jgi:hypothetical protein
MAVSVPLNRTQPGTVFGSDSFNYSPKGFVEAMTLALRTFPDASVPRPEPRCRLVILDLLNHQAIIVGDVKICPALPNLARTGHCCRYGERLYGCRAADALH